MTLGGVNGKKMGAMELKQLRHFKAIVEQGSYAGASRSLNTSQPSLTRSIQLLEARLGVRLLDRTPRGAIPTQAGSTLYDQATAVLNALARVEQDVVATAKGKAGLLKVGVAPMFAQSPMDDVIHILGEVAPALEFMILEGFFQDLMEKLMAAEIEAIICNFLPVAADAEVEFHPLAELQSYVVVGANHPLLSVEQVSLADIHRYPFALPGTSLASDLKAKLFPGDGHSAQRPQITSNSVGLMRKLVIERGFVSVLADQLIKDDVLQGKIHRVDVAGIEFRALSGIMVRKIGSQRQAVRQLVEATKTAFQKWKPST